MSQSVRVMVRIRPMNKLEKQKASKNIAYPEGNQLAIALADQPPRTFAYDNVFPPEVQQSFIYERSAFTLVQSVIQGYNGTIFAYGQTGCGKTFTMMGGDSQESKGIIPRSFEQLVSIMNSSSDKKFLVRVSFVEIYNEEVHDLLSKDVKEKKDVKQKPGEGFFVKDLICIPVKSVQEMQAQMTQGFKNRAVGQTLMNKESSRSHSIFTLFIETQLNDMFTMGKLNFVDLAGSEKQSKTKAQGDRFKQAIKINLSLSTLGNVISSLVDGKGHIPYRDSKLTKLLQDSLGGNTKTIMFANISPADYNYQQTLSTLHYASRAKFIKNKPKINQDPKDALLKEYAQEIKRLKQALQNGGKIPFSSTSLQDLDQDGSEMQKQLQQKDLMLAHQRQQKILIQQKLNQLQKQVVQGGSTEDPQAIKKYQRLRNKVQQQENQHERLLKQKQEKEKALITMKDKYTGLKEANQDLRAIIKNINSKIQEQHGRKRGEERLAVSQKNELLQEIPAKEKQLKFFQAIANMMLRPDQIQQLRSTISWDQEVKEFMPINFFLKKKEVSFPGLNSSSSCRNQFFQNGKDDPTNSLKINKQFQRNEDSQRWPERQKKYLVKDSRIFNKVQQKVRSQFMSLEPIAKARPKSKVMTRPGPIRKDSSPADDRVVVG